MPNITIPIIIGAGVSTTSGIGSISVQIAMSFLLCVGDSRRIPPPFQPNPRRRNVSNITKFIDNPPPIPARIVLPCVGFIYFFPLPASNPGHKLPGK
jgi:hypothetical protein